MAEREGFEPPGNLRSQRFSRPPDIHRGQANFALMHRSCTPLVPRYPCVRDTHHNMVRAPVALRVPCGTQAATQAGGVAEWFKAVVLKTTEAQASGGSNPSPSAIFLMDGKQRWGPVSRPPLSRLVLLPAAAHGRKRIK